MDLENQELEASAALEVCKPEFTRTLFSDTATVRSD